MSIVPIMKFVIVLFVLSGCALDRLEDDIQDRRASSAAGARPKTSALVVSSYCQWLERCNASEARRGECWMRVTADACDPELARMCRGEIDQMPCNDRLSVRCESCFGGPALPP